MIKNILRNIVGGAVALLILSTVSNVARADNAPIPDVMNSGALCDGVTDDTVAIQKAINITGRTFVIIPAGKTCIVSPRTHAAVPGVFGANSVALFPVSNQTWHIDGTLKLKAGSLGQSGAVIGNWQGNAITGVTITGHGTIDGNGANVPTSTISGIVLADCNKCVIEDVSIQNTTFLGAQYASTVQPSTTQQPTDVKMRNIHLTNIAFICLQLQYPKIFEVAGNVLLGCGDNGVDAYGDNGTTLFQSLTFLSSIHDNKIINTVGAGVFLESLAGVDVLHNDIFSNAGSGQPAIFLNRIHTDARKSIIAGNHMTSAGGAGTNGIVGRNSAGTANITDNYFDGYENAIDCDAGGCRSLYIHGNYYDSIGKYKLKIDKGTGNLFVSSASQEFNNSAHDATTGYPFTVSPMNNTANSPSRSVGSNVLPDFFTGGGTSSVASSAQAEFQDAHSGTLATSCSGFGSNHAVFVGAPFGTVICDTSGNMAQNRPIIIGGVQYITGSSPGTNEFAVGLGCTAPTGTGDFTAAINGGSAFTWQTYFPAWCTD